MVERLPGLRGDIGSGGMGGRVAAAATPAASAIASQPGTETDALLKDPLLVWFGVFTLTGQEGRLGDVSEPPHMPTPRGLRRPSEFDLLRTLHELLGEGSHAHVTRRPQSSWTAYDKNYI